MKRSITLASLRALGLLGLAAFIVVTQRPALAFGLRASKWLPPLWHRMCRRILGMEVTVSGKPLIEGPALFVANHISYLDVTALGSVVDACFVSRADVRDWPIFGYLSTLQRTIYVERRPRYARQQMLELADRLAGGDRLILFPEGTSSDGNSILPFKSTLFGAVELKVDGRAVPVQPISVAYTRLDGVPLGRHLRPLYAWYGDMDFASHFWCLLGYGRFRVDIVIHDPVTLEDFTSRKELSRHCERTIVRGFSDAISGKPSRSPVSTLALSGTSTA